MLTTVDTVAGAAAANRRPSGSWRLAKLAGGVAVYLVVWQVAGQRQWLRRTFPPLTDIVRETFDASRRDAIGRAFSATTTACAVGFVIGVTAAFVGAVVASVVPALRKGVDNLATILHAMPVIALAPLFIVTLGRERTPVAIAALAAGFAMFVAATAAVESARAVHHDVFTALGASRLRRFRSLQLPAAIPGFADGFRLAAPAAVLGAVLGEWFGAPRGLGVLIVSAMQNYQINLLWSAALLAALLSMVAFGLFTLLARWAASRWSS